MPDITIPVNLGAATGIDPTLLKPGYLQGAEGVVYSSGDPAAHKIGGRAELNASAPASAAVNGINFVGFDSGGVDYVTAKIDTNLYAAPSTTGIFASVRSGLTASASMVDRSKFADSAYFCNGVDTNWVYKNDNTTFRWGLLPQTVAPTGAFTGTGLTGTYIYWTTEYDSVNDVESANDNATLTMSPVNQTVRLTKPAEINPGMSWRVYRTIASGSYPVGWLVATVANGTPTYDDSTTDAALVLLQPYSIVSINEIPEPQNFPPPVLRSIATFEGSLVGVADRSLYYSETGTPHYFPESYAIPFRPRWGGQARCVRNVNKVLVVFFDHDSFRVNTLPKAADSFFDSGVVQEHIANYGTPSPLGACTFSGWGGTELVFLASRTGPMLTDGNSFDSAVFSIDWETLIPPSLLSTCVAIDNPDKFRVELYYNNSTTDSTSWRRLDFYYDGRRISQERGFPELAWTGPHIVPGPGTFGVKNGVGTVWAGSRAATGKVYEEESGTSDAALLVDGSGTVNFNLQTSQVYVGGINSQATATRIFLSKHGTGTGTYSVGCHWHHEGDQVATTTHPIDATYTGATSNDFNRHFQSVDVTVARNDALSMPPINNLTIVASDPGELIKANRR